MAQSTQRWPCGLALCPREVRRPVAYTYRWIPAMLVPRVMVYCQYWWASCQVFHGTRPPATAVNVFLCPLFLKKNAIIVGCLEVISTSTHRCRGETNRKSVPPPPPYREDINEEEAEFVERKLIALYQLCRLLHDSAIPLHNQSRFSHNHEHELTHTLSKLL